MELTIDLLLWSIWSTLLNPSLATILSLTLAARSNAWSSTPLQVALVYTTALWVVRAALALDARGYFLVPAAAHRRPRKLDWDSEVVLVTGGAGGLGGLIAEIYAMRGVAVAVVDVLDETRARCDEWEARGGGYFRCDVGDAAAVAQLKERVEAEIGTPTILINAAAIVSPGPLLQLQPDTISRTYATNLHSLALTAATFLPGMLDAENGGTIVTISSVLGQLGCAGLGLYTSSKAAATALHRSLAAELPFVASTSNANAAKIRTLLVSPGQLTTPLFAAVEPPSSFLGPIVPVQQLARRVVDAIDTGRSAELSLPLYARWIAWFGVLPPGLRMLARWWSGLDRSAWQGFLGAQSRQSTTTTNQTSRDDDKQTGSRAPAATVTKIKTSNSTKKQA